MCEFEDIHNEDAEDAQRAREALKDYYGTAMMNGFPMAVFDLAKVESMSDEEVLLVARKNGVINLENGSIKKSTRIIDVA